MKVLGRVITLTATTKRRYQRWWQGLGKRYNPQRTRPPSTYHGSTLVETTTSFRTTSVTYSTTTTTTTSGCGSTSRSFDESFELAKGAKEEREVEKPRRKHIHALVELIIPEVLEPGRDL